MRNKKTSYELSNSQVETPFETVKYQWALTHKYRPFFEKVIDFGAGDGRYAFGGKYKTYEGIEIDSSRSKSNLPRNAKIHFQCAFKTKNNNYSLCIGNPPYVRHHDLEQNWRDEITKEFQNIIGLDINRNANLYAYFILLGLLFTGNDGLVSLLVPFEWASRPSTAWLRTYIKNNCWNVDIYRFKDNIFDEVMTTASISIIDKRKSDSSWNYFEIDSKGRIIEKARVTTTDKPLIPYENRGIIWAMRGMSPGTQRIFTLTEGERIHAGLSKDDVLPCVTSLRSIPYNMTNLSNIEFKKHFIENGTKCWLIKSYENLNTRLQKYIDSIPESMRSTWTCINREKWYRFDLHPCPQIISASAFINHGPKILLNDVGAYAVGGVCGIYTNEKNISLTKLMNHLRKINFEKQLVAHSDNLKKIEIKQFNAVLSQYIKRYLNG